MWNLGSLSCLVLLLSCFSVAAQRHNTKWLTLSGDAPLVIARGGFSGLFPDSSYDAYMMAMQTSLPNVIIWCDVQLTKDGVAICFPDLKLDNASDIDVYFKTKKTKYFVNGVPTQGWFSVDFNFDDLAPVTLRQGVYSRTQRFDGTQRRILTVQDVVNQVKPRGLWLNIQHDTFFSQHNLSMRSTIISLSRSVLMNYISSTEVNFLRSIMGRLNPRVTKLIFRFLGKDDVEPSTNKTYGSLLKNLTFIKTFASGILVPKSYIWPVDNSLYLQPYTSLVLDAHKEGLQIFASEFANDVPFAYNYSYDPTSEYLSFVDNGDFSVDGVLSDFPITPSATIDCFTHLDTNDKSRAEITNPWFELRLYRNPKARNDGYFVSLVDFLAYAKNATTVSGVMISIENAAYLANQGFGVTAAVLEALRSAGYNNQTAKKVMIQSKDSSVLKVFKESRYELVYRVADNIRDIESSTISEIKSFANSVILTKKSVFPSESNFLVGKTDVVQKLQSSNLSVYIQGFNNEFVSQAWDFFSDSSVEINNYVVGAGIDGVITDFPGTAARYRRNRCLGYKDQPLYLSLVDPGVLQQFMARQLLPPAEAPYPILTESDVVESPLPPVAKTTHTAGNDSTANAAPTSPIGKSSVVAGVFTCCLAILLAELVIF